MSLENVALCGESSFLVSATFSPAVTSFHVQFLGYVYVKVPTGRENLLHVLRLKKDIYLQCLYISFLCFMQGSVGSIKKFFFAEIRTYVGLCFVNLPKAPIFAI